MPQNQGRFFRSDSQSRPSEPVFRGRGESPDSARRRGLHSGTGKVGAQALRSGVSGPPPMPRKSSACSQGLQIAASLKVIGAISVTHGERLLHRPRHSPLHPRSRHRSGETGESRRCWRQNLPSAAAEMALLTRLTRNDPPSAAVGGSFS